MLRDIGEISLSECNDANIPVDCFLHEPKEGELWRWTANNFMPRRETRGGSYTLEAETKEEILEAIRKYVVPLYEIAASNLREYGENYYWERRT